MMIDSMKAAFSRTNLVLILAAVFSLLPTTSPAQTDPQKPRSPETGSETDKKRPFPGRKVRRIQAITFAESPGRFYLPVDEAAKLLGWSFQHNETNATVTLDDQVIPYSELRRFVEGKYLIHMTYLIKSGAVIEKSEDKSKVLVTWGEKEFLLIDAPQRTEIDLTTQRLRSWQGKRLVLDCHISSGRYGTPVGEYQAGPYKARQHYSKLFNRASMPYSVQYDGHYFIHGFKTVPDYPASKGCIRMHLDHGNPAKFFYEWVKVGTPVKVYRSEAKEE